MMKYIEKLKKYGKKTISKMDMETVFATSSDEELLEIISVLSEQQFLFPIKSSKTNGNRSYPIYLKYKVSLPQDIKAYLDDSEYEYFRRIAVATKHTNSHLVRRLLQTSVFVEFPPVEYREIIEQLEHIGINLNQLASKAHSLGFIDEPQYRKNANEVWRMVARLAQIYVQVGARINDEICKRKGDSV